MNKLYVLFILLLATACAPRSTEPINVYPTLLPTPTLAVETRPIAGDREKEALNFFYELKNHMASGEFEHFAEEVRYPITINVNGQPRTFIFAAELTEYIPQIFSPEEISRFISIDETELTFTSNGVKVADGIIWFNLICLDEQCEDPEFLVTEINN